MSRGYRLAIIALGLTLFANATLAQESGGQGQPVPIDCPAYDNESRHETCQANDGATDAIYRVLVVRDEGEAVAAEEKEWRDNKRADQDLNAQFRMAVAAEKIVELTFTQIALAILGTAAVIYNLVLARRANEAAVESIRIARNADRPYITAVSPTIAGWRATVAGTYNSVSVDLQPRNIGKGIGFIESIGIAHDICFDGEQGTKPLTITSDLGCLPIGPGEELQNSGPDLVISIPEHERDRLISHEKSLYIYGHIRYSDIFGVFRRTGFMFKFIPIDFEPAESPITVSPHVYWYDKEEPHKKPNLLRRLVAAWRGE